MRMIGLDCGETEIRGMVCDQTGKMLNMARMASQAEKGVFQYIQNIQSLVNTLAQPYESIDGVGVASAGCIDSMNGIVTQSAIPGYVGTDLRAVVTAVLHTPVYVENNARTALIGEHWLGAAKNHEHVVMLTLGSTVGGATMVNGQIHRGSTQLAGDWEHMRLIPDRSVYTCEHSGCLEQYISAGVMAEQMEVALGRNACREEYQELYRSGNAGLAAILRNFSAYLAVAVANIEAIENPEIILLGGEFSESFDLFSPLLLQELEKYNVRTPVEKSQLGADAGCLGAVRISLSHIGFPGERR